MRTLLLLRHAKAREEPSRDDHARPLSPRGHRDAARLGERLAARGPLPSLVLCSTARRAEETWREVAPSLPAGTPVERDDALYLASARAMLDRLIEVDDAEAAVLLIAHNPGLAELAHALLRKGDAALRGKLMRGLPTSGLAVFSLPIERWVDAHRGGTLEALLRRDDPDGDA